MDGYTAYLIGTEAEYFFYGINCALVGSCLYVHTWRKKMADIKKIYIAVLVSQFLLSTASAILGLRMAVVAFAERRGLLETAILYFADVSNPLLRAKVAIISVNALFSDSIFVWRVYRVWDKSWKVAALPIILVLMIAACTIGQTMVFSRAGMPDSIYSPDLERWNLSPYVFSITANLLGTGLMAYRIWTMLQMSSSGQDTYGRLLTLIIELGMVCSLVPALMLVCYLTGHNCFDVIYETTGRLSSIVPVTILLLVGLKLTTFEDGFDRVRSIGANWNLFRPCRSREHQEIPYRVEP